MPGLSSITTLCKQCPSANSFMLQSTWGKTFNGATLK